MESYRVVRLFERVKYSETTGVFNEVSVSLRKLIIVKRMDFKRGVRLFEKTNNSETTGVLTRCSSF